MGLIFEKFNYVVAGRFKGDGLYKAIGKPLYALGEKRLLLIPPNIKEFITGRRFYHGRVPVYHVRIVWRDDTESILQLHQDTLRKVLQSLKQYR